jgi:Cof subfamily protein (haloacid dehalogenase superfamily)
LKQPFFLTDLDGTLLRSDATLSPYTSRILEQALERGSVISYATARSYTSSNSVVGAIPWKYPLVLYNGAIIFDPIREKVVDGNWLNRAATNEIIELGRAQNLLPLLFALDQDDREKVLHEKLFRVGDLKFYESRPNDPRFSEVACLECPESYRTLILTYIGLYEELEPLKLEVERRYGEEVHIHLIKDAYIEQHYFLEFSHRKANKNEGLKLWAGLMNCSPAEVTVFGDNLNDLGMFEAAGTSVAVSNANPQLLEKADLVGESNDLDGVAKYILEVLGI